MMLIENAMTQQCSSADKPAAALGRRQCPGMQMINIGTSKLYPWGWRLSLGLCMVPATTLLLGGIFLDDTPNSLCERGHPEQVGPIQPSATWQTCMFISVLFCAW